MADELLHALGKRQGELNASDPEHADAVEGDAGEALLDGLFEALDAEQPAPTKDTTSPSENVVELPKRRSPMWAAAAVAVAAAAALVLWFSRPAPMPTLPEYRAVSVSGGAAQVRGDRDDVANVVELRSPSDNVKFEFTAATPVKRAVSVSLLARPATGAAVFATLDDLEVSDSGSFRLKGPLNRFVTLSEGRWTLDIVVAPAGHAPTSAEEAASGDWQRVAIDVIIAAP